ncbi:GTPase IMAP family member 8-like isoform X2 [Toxotes jaculatrix]|uniref:GTPase IMAP family member 8-like isoform X2 n=1 Tax=Toxotes jaculatrix TaxID=941984 RepID=UPI001B3A9A6B|nr:GTPase IMAP family member 8-like isoform X2 [Toxotes jaculatrix]
MHSNRPPPPEYPQRLTIALFGKRVQLKNAIGNMILSSKNAFVTISNSHVVAESNLFKIINTADFLDEDCLYPDQQIIDFMAVSHPGPNLFILAVDSENTQEEKVVAQISRLQDAFGEKITAHLVVMLPDLESFHSLGHLRELFNILLAIANENLAKECRKWCQNHQPFLYDYKHYSQDVVMRRKTVLEKLRSNPQCHNGRPGDVPTSPHPSQRNTAYGVSENIFNIVLLGLTGTGKSASANTILAAGNSQLDPSQLFKSEPSSMPVTTQCEVRIMEKPFGMHVRVVDTPDFFHDQLQNPQAQIEECKRYCKQGQCVALLVLQLGRFTDVERGILENLENKLGWMIRESTIVVLTHGDDLKGNVEEFVNAHAALRNIIEMCGFRYHVLNNNSKDIKQVMELIKKIPNYKKVFPKFTKKMSGSECLVC